MIVMWSNKAVIASRVHFYLYTLFEKIFNIFHNNRFVFLSCILQSSVFGTKPCLYMFPMISCLFISIFYQVSYIEKIECEEELQWQQ